MRLLPLLRAIVTPVGVLAACQSDAISSLDPADDPAPLTVVPNVATVNGGNAILLTAKLRHEDGSYSELAGVVWSTSDGRIASVDGTGKVQGLRPGRTQIVATWQGSRGSSAVTVIDPLARKRPSPCLAALTAQNSIPPTGRCQ